MNSVIISFFIGLFKKISSLFAESKFCSLLLKFDLLIKNGIKNSLFYKIMSSQDNYDASYETSVSKPLNSFRNKMSNKLTWLSDMIDNSCINKFIKSTVVGFFDIPLRKFGLLFLLIGFFSVVRYITLEYSKVMILLSALIILISLLMIVLNKTTRELFAGSLFFKYVNLSSVPVNTDNYSFIIYGIIGLVFGVVSFFAGLIPVLLSICSIILIYGAFNYSFLAVFIIIVALPFLPTMVLVALSLLMIGIVSIKSIFSKTNKLSDSYSVMNLALAIYLVSLCFATIFSYTPVASLKITLVYFAFVLFCFPIIKTVNSTGKAISLINSIVVLSIPVSVYGIIQKFVGFDEQSTWHDENMFEEISGRVVSFFENPNVFGEYLIWIVIISLAVFFVSKTKKMKVLSAIAFVTACASMVFTYSRGCWIGVLVAIAIYLFLTNRKVFWTFILLGIVSIFFLPESIISRISSVGDLADTSTSYRVYIWKGTFEMLKDYWVTGIGMGSEAFNEVYPLYAYSAIRAPHPHNLYLLIISEMGILGVFSFVLTVFIYYKNMVKTFVYAKNKSLKVLSAAFLAGMTGYLIQGLFDNVWYNYRVYFLFWIFVAIATVIYFRSKEETVND